MGVEVAVHHPEARPQAGFEDLLGVPLWVPGHLGDHARPRCLRPEGLRFRRLPQLLRPGRHAGRGCSGRTTSEPLDARQYLPACRPLEPEPRRGAELTACDQSSEREPGGECKKQRRAGRVHVRLPPDLRRNDVAGQWRGPWRGDANGMSRPAGVLLRRAPPPFRAGPSFVHEARADRARPPAAAHGLPSPLASIGLRAALEALQGRGSARLPSVLPCAQAPWLGAPQQASSLWDRGRVAPSTTPTEALR